MITSECLAGFPQIFGCVWTNIFGTSLFGALVAFALVVYIMHKAGLNLTASIPLAVIALFSFLWMFSGDVFLPILSIAMLIGFAIFGFAIYKFLKR